MLLIKSFQNKKFKNLMNDDILESRKNNNLLFDFRFWIKLTLFLFYFMLIFLTLESSAFYKHWFKNNDIMTRKIEYETYWNVEGILTFFPIQLSILTMMYMLIGACYNKLENKSYFYSTRFKNIVLLINIIGIYLSIYELSSRSYFYAYFKSQIFLFLILNLIMPLLTILYCLFTSYKNKKMSIQNHLIDSFIILFIIFIHILYISIRKYLIDKDNINGGYLVSSFYSFLFSSKKLKIFMIISLFLIFLLLYGLFFISFINNYFYKIMNKYYQEIKIEKINFKITDKSFYKSFTWYLKLFLFLVCFIDLIIGFYKDCIVGEYWYVDGEGYYLRYWNAEGLLSFYSIQVSLMTTFILFLSLILHKKEHNIYILKMRFKNIILSWNTVMLFIFWAGILTANNIRGGFSEYSKTQIVLSVVSHLICPTILIIYYIFDSGFEKYKWSSLAKNEFFWVISYPIWYSVYVIFRAKIINNNNQNNVTYVWDYYYGEFMDFKNPPIFRNETYYAIFFYIGFTILYVSIYSFFNLLNNVVYYIKHKREIL